MPQFGSEINITIASFSQHPNTNPSSPPVFGSPSCSYSEATKQSTPKKSSLNFFDKKSKTEEIEEDTYSVITTAKSTERPCLNGHSLPLYPTITNPISSYQSQARIHQRQAQHQPHQINTKTLLPYPGFIDNTTIQPPTFIPVPARALQRRLIKYINTRQFSNQPKNFANTDKTNSFQLPQPNHSVSIINGTPQDISLISDTSIFDPLNSQFVSPTLSQIASNPFIPPQGPVTNIERLLSQAHWNHSFNIVNSSPSFQRSPQLSFRSTLPIITLSSNSPTPDLDQHSHQCIGK